MNLEFSVMLSTYLPTLLYSKLQVPTVNAFVAISSLYDSSTSEPQSTLSYLTVLYLSDTMLLF